MVYAALSRTTPGTRRVLRVLGERVQVRPDVTAPSTVARVRAARPDLVVSWFWTTRLPAEITALAPRGAFGVHPSLLPRHRGPDPYFHAIDAGDDVTGVTAHRIAEEYDTGAILAHRLVAIDPRWDAWQLARALDRPSLALLRDLARDPPVGGTPQDESLATLAPSPTDEELEIDWSWDTERVLRRVRAAAPDPGAWSFFGDEPVVVTRAERQASYPRALAPGEAAVVDGFAVVRTTDGAVRLLEGRMDAAEDEPPHELDAPDLADLVRAMQGEPPV